MYIKIDVDTVIKACDDYAPKCVGGHSSLEDLIDDIRVDNILKTLKIAKNHYVSFVSLSEEDFNLLFKD